MQTAPVITSRLLLQDAKPKLSPESVYALDTTASNHYIIVTNYLIP